MGGPTRIERGFQASRRRPSQAGKRRDSDSSEGKGGKGRGAQPKRIDWLGESKAFKGFEYKEFEKELLLWAARGPIRRSLESLT